MPIIRIAEAAALATHWLRASGASEKAALATAAALVEAEADGQSGHGLTRLAAYTAQLKAGKIDGSAVPHVTRSATAAARIDAGNGLAYPAIECAVEIACEIASANGVAAVGVYASHHIGQAGRPVEQVATRGFVGLLMSNTPKAMAFPGGARARLGTNPLAFAAPLPERAPLVIDLALSQVARSKIIAAKNAGAQIPTDWATDANGEATSDPEAALAGALAPIGGPKGAALAMMVEVLCAALAGGRYGWEATSFLDDKGAPPSVGQMLIALDPAAFSGDAFPARMAALMQSVASENGCRLPGDTRLQRRKQAHEHGLNLSPDLYIALMAHAEPT